MSVGTGIELILWPRVNITMSRGRRISEKERVFVVISMIDLGRMEELMGMQEMEERYV